MVTTAVKLWWKGQVNLSFPGGCLGVGSMLAAPVSREVRAGFLKKRTAADTGLQVSVGLGRQDLFSGSDRRVEVVRHLGYPLVVCLFVCFSAQYH